MITRQFTSGHVAQVWKRAKMSGGDTIFKRRSNPIITKLNTPEFQSIFSPELKVVIELFKENNYELRLAGGPVR